MLTQIILLPLLLSVTNNPSKSPHTTQSQIIIPILGKQVPHQTPVGVTVSKSDDNTKYELVV